MRARTTTWISDWNPENEKFWNSKGKFIARRNLIWSIVAENVGFSVWLIWSIVATKLPQAGFHYTTDELFQLLALPGLIAATIFAFTVSWAQFLYPLVFTTSTDQLVMPVGIITSLSKGDVFNWGQIMTGALLGAAPPLIIYAFLMDYYIAGLTAGATKG